MRRWLSWVTMGLVIGLAVGCATTDRTIVPDAVRFHITGVSDVSLGGVDLNYVKAPGDLSASDLLALTASTGRGTLPLELTLHVAADNPESNPSAVLTRLEWTLQIEGRDAGSGVFSDPVELPAGVTTDIAVPLQVDVQPLLGAEARDDVARILGDIGAGGGPLRLRLLARPVVETPYGTIRYPDPIVITTNALP